MAIKLEHEMLDKLAGDMAKEIDHDLLVDLLNWTKVELPPFDNRYHAVDIVNWCYDNCTSKYMNFGTKFAFEQTKDAEWFILRWVS
jgi:hypothetical protein